ncbi:MAG: pentapeptide repeat-containing protein, partial [Planctomycetota bacterium]|nr:pentapeptide repeat-containing protein [Planctomycetota bacterium]
MRRITLVIILLFSATCADAASYQKTDGTIVDPIQNLIQGGNHVYSGNNLQPGANLLGANLGGADLTGADLTGADLESASL